MMKFGYDSILCTEDGKRLSLFFDSKKVLLGICKEGHVYKMDTAGGCEFVLDKKETRKVQGIMSERNMRKF